MHFSCSVEFYDRGVLTSIKKSLVDQKLPEKVGGGKRGEISGWSKHSRSRLRNFLLTSSADGTPEALTLTVPGDILSEEDWYSLAAPFWLKVAKLKIPCVWRIELQQRKQPHIHLICWGSGSSFTLADLWKQHIARLPPVEFYDKNRNRVICSRLALPGAWDHCATPSLCEGDGVGWWRYLCDHASKGKQAQLGWEGRQWGVVYRKGFHEIIPSKIDLTLQQWNRFMRALRRLTRSRVWRGSIGRSVWFSSPATVRRLVDWARCF